MRDFIFAALPFVIMGICIIILCVNHSKKDTEKTYLNEGMLVGMCLGCSVSSVLHVNMGLAMSMGILIGEIIGILIKRSKYSEK
ncbi:MAG: hypothetical protein ACI4HI_09325 [Lachnospiraceae bacterium]